MPGQAQANPICDAYDAVNSRLGHPVQAYCVDDPNPIWDLLELEGWAVRGCRPRVGGHDQPL